MMQRLGIEVPVNKNGSPKGESPKGWTWHHHPEPGVMQLVPTKQHKDKKFGKTLHPDGRGGFVEWGRS